MNSSRTRSNFIGIVLRILFTISIVAFTISAVTMFIVGDADGIMLTGISACAALIGAIGLLLLLRWHKTGFFVTILVYMAWAAAAYLVYRDRIASWGGEAWVFVPAGIAAGMLLVLSSILFPAFGGKSQWSQMSSGLDLKHFRHIYQLSAVIVAGLAAAMYFLPQRSQQSSVSVVAEAEPVEIKREISYTLLDSANVRLDEVVAIENMLDTLSPAIQSKYRKRVFALKHILLSGIMPERHDARNLLNICNVHSGAFSEQQQSVIDWFVALPEEKRALWDYCPATTDLYDFKVKLEQQIKTSKK